MYKIGAIGERSSILGFHAAGIEIRSVIHVQEAIHALHKMSEEGFAIIYLTEDFAQEMTAEIERYRNRQFPAVIPIPCNNGKTGMGMAGIKSAVERAVGADILFRES